MERDTRKKCARFSGKADRSNLKNPRRLTKRAALFPRKNKAVIERERARSNRCKSAKRSTFVGRFHGNGKEDAGERNGWGKRASEGCSLRERTKGK